MFYSCKFLSQVTFESDFRKKTFWCVIAFSVLIVSFWLLIRSTNILFIEPITKWRLSRVKAEDYCRSFFESDLVDEDRMKASESLPLVPRCSTCLAQDGTTQPANQSCPWIGSTCMRSILKAVRNRPPGAVRTPPGAVPTPPVIQLLNVQKEINRTLITCSVPSFCHVQDEHGKWDK